MATRLGDEVEYGLRLYDVLDPKEVIPLNEAVGKDFRMSFEHQIHCVVTGKKIKKAYGEGMSYDAFISAPEASPSIIRPELSRIHEGIALRDFEWEMKNHMTPHTVYLAQTAGVKVGVTRNTQVPTRWIDQGAVKAIRLAETPYRQAAGLIEVALKDYISDKTSWQKMLKGELIEQDMHALKEEMKQYVPTNLAQYISSNDELVELTYPVLANPPKVKSIKLDKVPFIEKKLMGIKGQYLMFDDGSVLNVRSHSGYRVQVEF
ncbi:MAG: DUF2797 domain-containing protein [Bacteroidia bacterium]|nr:DUF2797 domain-containing protein [Bacteroidia bacterium]